MIRRIGVAALLALAIAVAPAPAEASTLRLGLGAHYWFGSKGLFDFNLAITTPLARALSIGGRFGAALTTNPTGVAIPIDLLVDVHLTRRLYLELAVGPWIFVDSGSAVRAHVSFAFGLDTGSIMFGPEVGYLDPNGIIGLRLGFRI